MPNDTKIITESEFPQVFGSFIRQPASFLVAFYACVRQLGITKLRNQQVFVARRTQVAGMGVIIALFFAPLKNNHIGVSNGLGLVQEVTSLYYCGMLNNLSSYYPDQRNYFYHEDGPVYIYHFF
ncbi:putative ABC transporter [Wickerhamomyces ciferrii]|uniref:ABC transporter n=1 Tax=Wickerhamomyces ciferrii (strain ATCC 14091 / BCRC 22168 / CBS 111 / JCM 3599 / NBRC 0793 / NRRL Y-1031 F-60-10) TaxID=1206466 RepID=K0L0E3_WICCF|nr:putative ABC transporter [Wickerhamomyces ciferrii]CCH46898.1 putative ABC transporter [Wickerhamomyces ciferrii]